VAFPIDLVHAENVVGPSGEYLGVIVTLKIQMTVHSKELDSSANKIFYSLDG